MMIITDYPVCEIHMPIDQAVYERPCTSLVDPNQRGRWEEHLFVFFPDADTRVMFGFSIDSVEKGMFSTNVLNFTTWKRGGPEKGVAKQFRSPDAFCFVRNGKPACTFTIKGGQIVSVDAK